MRPKILAAAAGAGLLLTSAGAALAGSGSGSAAVTAHRPVLAPQVHTTTPPAPPPAPTPPAAPPAPPPVAGRLVPVVDISPALVTYGQVATVRITGTPGAVVDLYSRRYPTRTFTKIRDGLRLDGTGKVVVATRPDVNLRFQARDRLVEQASSIAGTRGLMTVRKAVSATVSRVRGRTYRIAGTITPRHPGATVTLLRNGASLRSGVPVSANRTYAVTVTLPRGTSHLQVRTSASGYNAASASAPRTVQVP